MDAVLNFIIAYKALFIDAYDKDCIDDEADAMWAAARDLCAECPERFPKLNAAIIADDYEAYREEIDDVYNELREELDGVYKALQKTP